MDGRSKSVEAGTGGESEARAAARELGWRGEKQSRECEGESRRHASATQTEGRRQIKSDSYLALAFFLVFLAFLIQEHLVLSPRDVLSSLLCPDAVCFSLSPSLAADMNVTIVRGTTEKEPERYDRASLSTRPVLLVLEAASVLVCRSISSGTRDGRVMMPLSLHPLPSSQPLVPRTTILFLRFSIVSPSCSS